MIEYLLYVVNLLAAVDIYRDSKSRPNGFLYPILGLILGIPGMVVYNIAFGGNVALAIRSRGLPGKPGPFAGLGATFTLLGSIFFFVALYMVVKGQNDLEMSFLLISGIIVALLGGFFLSYDRKKRSGIQPN